ncbi:hypothetical protein QBC46DRAFT_396241 [Diplogelasinospora grovesii]|uniref:Uncharacterized protein n=1 Tax=Diplogelasinospora grovesii TaxID=303347 RepID=A0AAN6N202_9PEZI|nr:hypothetical protein QBC46DRAFT_396241 [Diplogelasinospora grovesii]
MQQLDVLILGAGWSATFLIPLLRSRKLAFTATTTDGRSVAGCPTLRWKFDPTHPDDIATLPRARYILITFPLVGKGPSELLVKTYDETHRRQSTAADAFRFIQLGSTGIWQQPEPGSGPWMTRHSPYKSDDRRAVAEDELLALGGCVLDLAGLWGGERDPRHWVDRVATTKEAVRAKKSLHMIHGVDVARGIAAVVQGGDEKWATAGKGQRWMLTDGFVYDWWALFAGWAEISKLEDKEEGQADKAPSKQATWVFELMVEEGVRALPRSMEMLGRCYDTREFWAAFGLAPVKGRI